MTDLSPPAKAVLKAAYEATRNPNWQTNFYSSYTAAMLRALADQVVPESLEPPCGEDWPWPPAYQQMSDAKWEQRQHTRSEILAIAAELEGGR
jgi:hypothetical protein